MPLSSRCVQSTQRHHTRNHNKCLYLGILRLLSRTAALTLMFCMYSLGSILEWPSTIQSLIPDTMEKNWSPYPSTESFKLSAVSCFSCFLAADPFEFPNFLYSQRIALSSFKASSRNSSSLDLDCATIADILLILMIYLSQWPTSCFKSHNAPVFYLHLKEFLSLNQFAPFFVVVVEFLQTPRCSNHESFHEASSLQSRVIFPSAVECKFVELVNLLGFRKK